MKEDDTLNNYELKEIIGQGQYGKVYLSKSKSTN